MDLADLSRRAFFEHDRRALSRLLRVVEDRRDGWRDLASSAWARGGAAHLVGITGAPGTGKSTLTNALIEEWRSERRAVGVVAVDPSSPFSGGALLGDRIRMQEHISDQDVFVRSMSARGRLGGLADATAAVTSLVDAAGFDPVVVETVGVGQSEVEVIDHVDTVVVVVTPGWGDSVQVDKAGLLEIADILVVNKADRPGADETAGMVESMVEGNRHRSRRVPVVTTVATGPRGVDTLAAALEDHRRYLDGPEGDERRRRRAGALVRHAVVAGLAEHLMREDAVDIADVASRRTDPWTVADRYR